MKIQIYKCDKCGARYDDTEEIRTIMADCDMDMNIPCDLCAECMKYLIENFQKPINELVKLRFMWMPEGER